MAGGSEGTGEAEHDDRAGQISVADLDNLGHRTGQGLSDGVQENVGDQAADDDRIGHDALLGEHRGTRRNAVQHESA